MDPRDIPDIFKASDSKMALPPIGLGGAITWPNLGAILTPSVDDFVARFYHFLATYAETKTTGSF